MDNDNKDGILLKGWEITVKRGDWYCTVTGDSPESCFDKAMEQYDLDNFPDRDRYGNMN